MKNPRISALLVLLMLLSSCSSGHQSCILNHSSKEKPCQMTCENVYHEGKYKLSKHNTREYRKSCCGKYIMQN